MPRSGRRAGRRRRAWRSSCGRPVPVGASSPEPDAAGGRPDEPDVVAADADRDERGVARQGEELRRVVAAEHALRREHVLGRRCRAADVTERRCADRRGDERRVVAVRARAADRVAVLVGDERSGRVGVAQRDVDARSRTSARRRRSRSAAPAPPGRSRRAGMRRGSCEQYRAPCDVGRGSQMMPTSAAQTQLPAPRPSAHSCAASRSCSAFGAR